MNTYNPGIQSERIKSLCLHLYQYQNQMPRVTMPTLLESSFAYLEVTSTKCGSKSFCKDMNAEFLHNATETTRPPIKISSNRRH